MTSGVIVFDKPEGWTSHDAVDAFRKRLNTRRIGHLGTLDPAATGVLVLAVGEALKLISFAKGDKLYEAVVELGQATDTGDREGRVIAQQPPPPIEKENVEKAVLDLERLREQIPPMFSAKKIKGKKLYQWARKGYIVDRPAQPIRVHEARLLDFQLPCIRLRLHCSAGTYVRALAEELGKRLGTCAHLARLRRLRVGTFSLEEAVSWSSVSRDDSLRPTWLQPAERLVEHYEPWNVSEEEKKKISHGSMLRIPPQENEKWVRVVDAAGAFFAMACIERDEKNGWRLSPKRLLNLCESCGRNA